MNWFVLFQDLFFLITVTAEIEMMREKSLSMIYLQMDGIEAASPVIEIFMMKAILRIYITLGIMSCFLHTHVHTAVIT